MPVSVVPHRAHVVASPQRRPLRLPTAMSIERRPPRRPDTRTFLGHARALLANRWRTGLIIAAPIGLPTAISTQQAVHFGTQTPAAYSLRGARLIIMACRLDRCGTPRSTDRDFHSAGGVLRHADARGGFRPANAARTPPHFFPTCDVQEANLFI